MKQLKIISQRILKQEKLLHLSQTLCIIEFVNLYVKSLANNAKKSNQEVTKAKYKNASIKNSRFNDMDKEITYAYVDNSNYITNFSLDTDWIKALAEVKK